MLGAGEPPLREWAAMGVWRGPSTVLALLLLLCPLPAPACPTACRCWAGDVDCRQRALHEVPPRLPTNASTLWLGYNFIAVLRARAFPSLPALLRLSLPHNHLGMIDRQALVGLGALQELDLSNNYLAMLSPESFLPLGSLVTLNLGNNRLEELGAGVLSALPQLHELFLHGNPWVCSCSILPLWRWLGHNRDKVPGECPKPPPAPSSLIIPISCQAMGLRGWGSCGCSKVSQKTAPLGWICPWVWSLVPPSSGWWLVPGHQQGFPAEADWVMAPGAVPGSGTSPATGRARGDGQRAPVGWTSPLTWPRLSSSSPFPSAIRRMGLILHFFLREAWREAAPPAGSLPLLLPTPMPLACIGGGLSVASPGWLLTAAHACPQGASPTALPAPSCAAPSCPAQHCAHLPVPSHSPRRRTYASAGPSLCPLCPALGYLGQHGPTVPVLLP